MISIHAPHEGERPYNKGDKVTYNGISIHAPHEGERRSACYKLLQSFKISIHAPHEGERPKPKLYRRYQPYFNPRSPRGGATDVRERSLVVDIISIHAPHEGERPYHSGLYGFPAAISIHAPHEGERRASSLGTRNYHRYFNPRSPRGGATMSARSCSSAVGDFNPRSPRGGATA